ncbi:hypothetical protein RchiOBHm_Chr4g0427951 [Rosa chinensis]|uniref:Uncharacterized protein n=1 Tax=Rosa chinensis TaxID=74649 RepID=A0A2P6QZV7_ROSCH|nr:hypothetical protein RchiOBHm_Chr4g0427951 [Rosa chinensis]
MVRNGTRKEASVDETASYTLCEMIAYWIQLQLRKQYILEVEERCSTVLVYFSGFVALDLPPPQKVPYGKSLSSSFTSQLDTFL